MNKKMLLGAATALSMVVGSTAAMAGPSDKVVFGNVLGNQTYNLPSQAIGAGIAAGIRALAPDALKGAVYAQASTVAGNTETATPTVSTAFSLEGTVSKDCSFYTGGTSAQAIQLGTIGVTTGNNVNTNIAFNQVSDINVAINTTTAGCNTNNQITITKGNGVAGLLNSAATSYDSNQFTNKIPYSVKAAWVGVGLVGPATGGNLSLTAATTDSFKAVTVGAWRSALDLTINAPTQSKGLIAGTYSDTVTVELKAVI